MENQNVTVGELVRSLSDHCVSHVEGKHNKNAHRLVEELDIPLIIPGESWEFLMNAQFSWYGENCLRLLGNVIYGGIWIFWYIQSGEYQVRITYENQLFRKKMITLKEGRTEIDGFWQGKVITSFRSLSLS